MPNLSIDDFKGQLIGGGARGNLFAVSLTYPDGLDIALDLDAASFMVKGAQLPGSTIAPVMVPFRGRQLQIAGDRTFEPWTITVINDTNFAVRNAMEVWMGRINNHLNNTGLVTPSSYMADLWVKQLDKDGTPVKTYKMTGCWPSTLAPIEVAYDQEGTIEEFTVEFQITYWSAFEGDEGDSLTR